MGSRVYSDSHLNHLYNTEKIVLYDPLRPEVLRRVREAAAASRTMRLDHKQILFDQELVDC